MKLSREFKKGDKTVAIVMTLEGEMLETVVSTGGKVERVSGEASTDSFGDYSKLVQAKLKAGFVPGPLANAPAVAEELLVRSLTVFGLSDLLEIFTEAEREEIVLREIQKAEAAGKAIGPYGDGYAALDLAELMMKCPNRALLRHLLACLHDGRLTKLYASATTIDLDVFARTIANAARVPANRDWIIEEITRALATAEPELKKWLKARIAKFGQQTKLETALNSVPARPAALEESLLEEIGKDPANDEPRQVWADWLQERGSPWGEVVGLQCEEARLAAKPWSDATQARIDTIGERLRAIEPRARAKFLEPIKAFISDSDIERGLLNRVTASLEKLLKPGAAEAVILRAPSAELSLAGVKKAHGPQLAALPTGRFSSLKLAAAPAGDALEVLVRSPLVAGITSVDIWRVDDSTVTALAALNPSVRRVTLWRSKAGTKSIATFVRSPVARSLEELAYLSPDVPLPRAAVELITSMRSLRALWLPLGERDCGSLLARLTALSTLVLHTNGNWDDLDCAALAESGLHLHELRVDASAATAKGASQLLRLGASELQLEYTGAGLDFGRAKASRSARFTSPGFNDADALALTASEFGRKLETLEIKTEALGDKGALALMTIPALESNLTLTGMTLSAATAKKLRAFKADYQQWRQ